MRWLHVHPDYIVTPESWDSVRLASQWREGVLPESGGVGEQAAMTVACIEVVLSAWSRMRAARNRKDKE
ncbi:hypothetical protein [Novosphingobium mangrovi (ex Huang et al. 2023)]|uniref:Uncharacterized protein n=1 Tax=Novosphingobium mangrovi (ex Huang et al. 2023) TaxID=2976432 RepID=A0ABT2I151_9SPHN|nr:hypothetical protein [Novosphingobium mangrovi (ex Huang et al. 2023)]MCT2398530.1 hypothetical protein [Novosphingobium mangrovi (ex Huang et al. 2023)]